MKLDDVRESDNVKDERAKGRRAMAVGGGIGGLGLLLMVGLVLLRGGNLGDVFKLMQQQQQQPQQPGQPVGLDDLSPEERKVQDEQVVFIKKILALTEDVWDEQFAAWGDQYRHPQLKIFRGSTETRCGEGQAAMGPFYCPADDHVYIDLSFYDQLENELRAPGDFARAYVIAHEVGHHVQNLLGYSDLVHDAQQRGPESQANQMSVRLELQADYLAGVWAHHAEKSKRILEPGDIEEGLRAAQKIGDDMLQKQATGRVMPEKFTHGSSAQRMKWLKEGLRTGDASKRALERFFRVSYGEL